MRLRPLVALLLLGLLGCSRSTAANKADAPGSPEAAYRQFMLANLEGTEGRIRPLIVERTGAELLWQGPYPAEVAKALAAQYRELEIVRVSDGNGRVSLKSSAAPVSLELVLEAGAWKVDPAPIIAFRQKAAGAAKQAE